MCTNNFTDMDQLRCISCYIVVWYLGIIEAEMDDGTLQVIHLKRIDKDGQKWMLPENPERLLVEKSQILLSSINVMYFGISCRIELNRATTKQINDCLQRAM